MTSISYLMYTNIWLDNRLTFWGWHEQMPGANNRVLGQEHLPETPQ